MTVVLSGHGGFELDTNPPWVTVPSGATIYFYTENMKALLDSLGGEMETLSSAFRSASPSQTVAAGERCMNYTLYPPDDLNIQQSPDDVDQYTVTAATTLQELITGGVITGEVYWAACRVVDFNEVGGSLIGVNAAQTDFGHEGGDVGTLIDDDDDQVQDADEWLRRFWRRTEASQIRWFERLPSGHKRLYSDYSPDLATWARQHGYIV